MAKTKKSLVTNLTWDIVECEVVFGEYGIQLNTTERAGQPDLAQSLAHVAEKTRPATKATLELSAIANTRGREALAAFDREAARLREMTRDWGLLSSIVFRPKEHKITISRSRATHLIFYTTAPAWQFEHPGIFLDNPPLDPAIGTLADPVITNNQQMVYTTFLPAYMAVATQIKYNLKLITEAFNHGTFGGHAIIIVDPIIETGKD